MGIVRKSIPPPNVKEGEILGAAIKDIQFPVESRFNDDQGNPQYQIRFRVQFENGYECPVWMRYYERPSDRSKHGQLILTLQQLYNKVYETNEEAFKDLKAHGRIYVKCKGFRERNELLYPKFEVVASKLPPRQAVFQGETTQTKSEEKSACYTMDEIREITKGWPKEAVEAWIQKLKEQGQLKENL